MIIGYARVSTKDQNLENQIQLLKERNCEKIFSDVASGVKEDRTGLLELLDFARPGDTVLVYKNDRIFRSLKNMVELIETFNQKKIHFKSITEPEFDTNSANGKFLLQIFSAVAEFERNLISERTKHGLEGARRTGRKVSGNDGSSCRPHHLPSGHSLHHQYAGHGFL